MMFDTVLRDGKVVFQLPVGEDEPLLSGRMPSLSWNAALTSLMLLKSSTSRDIVFPEGILTKMSLTLGFG